MGAVSPQNIGVDWDKKQVEAEAAKEHADGEHSTDEEREKAEQASKDAQKAADDAKVVYEELYDFYLEAVAARKGADHAKLDYEVTFPENLEWANTELDQTKDSVSACTERVTEAKETVQECLDALPLDKRSTE